MLTVCNLATFVPVFSSKH